LIAEPVAELTELGEKLQQAIVLTRIRVDHLPPSRVRARAARTVEHANKLFMHVSQVVQATTALKGFMHKTLGVTVDDIFNMTGNARIAKGATNVGVFAVNETVRRSIDELAAINAAIDEEVKHGEKKSG
jgi:hypothetical protein